MYVLDEVKLFCWQCQFIVSLPKTVLASSAGLLTIHSQLIKPSAPLDILGACQEVLLAGLHHKLQQFGLEKIHSYWNF